jgi:hypothetical protein
VGFDVVDRDVDAGFFRGDAGVDHHAVGHLAEAHGDEVGEADVGARQPGAEPDAEEGEDDAEQEQAENGDNDQDDGGQIDGGRWCMAWSVGFGWRNDEAEIVRADDFERGPGGDLAGLAERFVAFAIDPDIAAG